MKLQSFYSIVDVQKRLEAIKTQLQTLKNVQDRIVFENNQFLLGSSDYEIKKEFLKKLLDEEFQIASTDVARDIMTEIARYINGEATKLDTIVETINNGKAIKVENSKGEVKEEVLKPFVCQNDDDNDTVADKRLAIESNIISEFIFKYGLEKMQSLVEFKLEEFKFSATASPSECALQTKWRGNYQPSIMLEREQVSAITKTLLGDSDHIIYQIDLYNKGAAKNKDENIKTALLQAKQGKPVALQLSNDSHWITLMLLPDKTEHNKINLVVMDSINPGGELANSVVEQINKLQNKIGVTVSSLHNLSVIGQQYSQNCGLATACNTASIFKTYESYEDAFEVKTFKNSLEQNIYFHKKADAVYYCLGQHTYLGQTDIVNKIGTQLFLRSATKQSLQANKVTKPEGALKEFFNQLATESKEEAKPKVVVVEKPLTHSELETKLNNILSNEQAKKILARYLRENQIKEETITVLGINEELQGKVKTVLALAKPNRDISLGMINGFILWLATLIGWEKSDIFSVVERNTDAKRFVDDWQGKIKADQAKKKAIPQLTSGK